MASPIYLDNSATTRVRDEVVEAMMPYLASNWGNPSSIHKYGRQSRDALATARKQVATLLNCQPEEIYFAPGGTYANNIAILGRARFCDANDLGRHLITTQIEHAAVLGPVKFLESQGWKVTYLPVNAEGFVSPDELSCSITPETSIISIMWANNEIGVVEPIQELASIAAHGGIYFHTDAIQVAGRMPLDLASAQVSTLSLSGHKFYAPKGIGVLFVRKGINLMPLIFGGGQEQGVFPGTEALANIVGMGTAAQLCHAESEVNLSKLRKMQELIFQQLDTVKGLRLTGPQNLKDRLPGHLSIVIPGIEGETLVLRADLKGICISSASACHRGIIEPSHVLKAIGLSNAEINGSARITCGRYNTEEECMHAAKILTQVFASCPRSICTTAN